MIKIEHMEEYRRALAASDLEAFEKMDNSTGTLSSRNPYPPSTRKVQGVKEKLLNLVSVGKIEEFNRFLERNKSYHLNLSGINLARADLSDIYLVGVNLVSSDLSNAVIVHGNLSQANLSGANLSGAIIQGAVLQGADLRAAEKLPISKEHAQSLGAII